MAFPVVYLSKPSISLPEEKFSNEDIIKRLKENFSGDPSAWAEIESAIQKIWEMCDTKVRYLDLDPTHHVADYAVRSSQACLEANQVTADDLDLVIYGGIAREYFEPATAMEVAGKLGVKAVHAFDVTSACAGMLEGAHIASAHLGMKESHKLALVCAAELTREFLSFSIQKPEELILKVAGLTIGNAAASWLVGKEPFPGGCMKLMDMQNYSLPGHWGLCSAPIDGSFNSFSKELFKLNVHCAPQMKIMLDALGWDVADIDHFVFHQPSKAVVLKVLSDLGADPEKAVFSHHLYANTSSTTVPLAMHQLLQERKPKAGDKFLLSTAAAGFTVVNAAGEWVA